MTTQRAALAAAAAALIAAGAFAAAQYLPTAAAAAVQAVPSPSASDVPWCTSEAPPSSYPGGPSYSPQCPGPYVSPTGGGPVPIGSFRMPTSKPVWLDPQGSPSASAGAAGCRTVQDWRTVQSHRYRIRLCGDRLVLDQS